MKYTICFIILILLIGCASGSTIVTGTPRTPIDPNSVKLYVQEPVNYEVIGLVEASSDSGWTAQESQDYAIDELKNQAAKIGANGVLLNTTGSKTSTMVGTTTGGIFYAVPIEAKTVSGVAIFVSK